MKGAPCPALALAATLACACASPGPGEAEGLIVASAIAALRENHLNDASERELESACAAGRETARPSSLALDADALTRACLGAMLARLGNDARVLDSRAMAGTGIEFAARQGGVRILRALEGSPAQRAGVSAGDNVASIDGVPVDGMAQGEVTRRLLGAPGTSVTLAVRSSPIAPARVILLTREKILPLERPEWRRAPGNIVYIRFPRFGTDSQEQLVEAMRAALEGGAIEGLVLDLRGNAGGLLVAGVGIAAAFLPASATVVEFRGRAAGSNLKLSADRGQGFRGESDPLAPLRPLLQSLPLAVWIDAGSAGGAAIATAALQDHRRALVVGLPTAGSDLVTTLLALPSSTLVLEVPTARWLRPSGRHARVVPNLAIDLPADAVPGDDLFATLARALRIMAQPGEPAPRPPGEANDNHNGRKQ